MALILYALIGLKPGKNEYVNNNFDLESRIRAMDRSIENADNTTNELVKFSQEITSELDNKYQQLLYLYSLIDEKSDKMTKNSIDYVIDEKINPAALTPMQKREAVKKAEIIINHKYKEVFDLYSKGFAVHDIAKTLNIGQGEVKLVLELGKGR